MKIKDRETMNLLKINLDLVMLILLILKNTALEITEVEVDNPQEKRPAELQQELLLKLF